MRTPVKTLIILIAIVLINANGLFAQADKNEQLALQYFTQGEFNKASDLYEKLFDRNPDDLNFYQHYLECLLNLKE